MQAKNRSGKREFNDKWEQDFLYLWGWDARILGIQKQDKGILRRAIKQVCVDKWRIDFPRTPARRFELSGVNSVI